MYTIRTERTVARRTLLGQKKRRLSFGKDPIVVCVVCDCPPILTMVIFREGGRVEVEVAVEKVEHEGAESSRDSRGSFSLVFFLLPCLVFPNGGNHLISRFPFLCSVRKTTGNGTVHRSPFLLSGVEDFADTRRRSVHGRSTFTTHFNVPKAKQIQKSSIAKRPKGGG